jgi:3-deoxy-D-manno-octulosonate 8-phosphate phosphatase KdsC-like HAD superfamily phosphatase
MALKHQSIYSGEIKSAAAYVTHNQGGRGAVREVAELILKSQNKWTDVLEFYGA